MWWSGTIHQRTPRIVAAIMMAAIIAAAAAGCGSSGTSFSWVDITTKKLSPKVIVTIGALAYDPVHNLLFAGTSGSGVLRCAAPNTDPIWTSMTGGQSLDFIQSIYYEPTHNVLYVGTGSGVYSWANPEGAGSWKTTSGVGENFSLAYDPESDVLYSGTRGGLYRCTNPSGSPSWAMVEGGPHGATTGSLLFDNTRHIVFAATDSQGIGVWKYQGGVWTNLDKNFSKSKSIGGGAPLAYDPKLDILYQPALDRRRIDQSPAAGIMRCDKATTAPVWSSLKGQDSYYFDNLTYDAAANVLYAGAFVPEINPALGITEPKFNENSHGLFAIASPDADPVWTNTGGPAKSKDVGDITYDPVHHVLYAIAAGGVWRVTPPATGR
jgi:hypothetical protein